MNPLGLAFALGAAITWGMVYTIEQKILTTVSPVALLGLTYLAGALVIGPILIIKWSSIKPLFESERSTLYLIMAAEILTVVATLCIYSGIKILGASSASIFEISYPFFIILFTWIAFHKSPNLYFLLGSLFMFLGATIIIRWS